MKELLLDALFDSAKIFIFVFAINFIFSFFEDKISQKNLGKNYASVPLAASLGLLPQCCFSVVAADKYAKRKISAGTVIAVFVATSDEAIPVFLSSANNGYAILPMLALKFLIALIAGYLFDLIFPRASISSVSSVSSVSKNEEQNSQKNAADNDCAPHGCSCGCCSHSHETNGKNHYDEQINAAAKKEDSTDRRETDRKKQKLSAFLDKHVFHTLLHSLKTFAAVLIINVVFAVLLYYITEERLIDFLQTNKYFAPAVSSLVGLIPNCASSVLLSKLYLAGGISFGACLSGLTANAGLGLLYLFKAEKNVKNVLTITAYLIIVSVLSGYLCCIIAGF